jgi:tRNA dimethylallyltransferase
VAHLALVGPTASGKSALALELARRDRSIEIVSVDSMQVYRGMDIGTAKPAAAERAQVRHHLIDLADPWEDFTVARFQRAFGEAMADISSRGKRALLVGGTGLYLRAVIDDLRIPGQYPGVRAELEAEPDTGVLYQRMLTLDPVAAGRMEPGNRRRILRALEVTLGSSQPFSSFGPGLEAYPPTRFHLLGIAVPADVLARRIAERYHEQVRQGFVEEVQRLVAHPKGWSRTARQALGYREIGEHVAGHLSLEQALEQAIARTRRFARRQRAWFRRDPRIEWFEGTEPAELGDALAARALDR